MKKKIALIIMALVCSLIIAFAFTACDNKPSMPSTPSTSGTPSEGHNHNFSTTWSKNDTHHWHDCSGCNEKDNYVEHDFTNGDCECGDKNYSKRLGFSLIDDSSYAVVGLGYCVDKDIIIPEEHNGLPVEAIGNWAFSNHSSLTSISVPDSVTSIGASAFYDCSGLTDIALGDGVTSIGESAFSGCKSLTGIALPDGLRSIGDGGVRVL